MRISLRQLARKSKAIIVAYKVYQNWCAKRRFRSGNCESTLGSTHIRLSLNESLQYINTQFNDYFRYGGLSKESIRGKRVLEVGFGDNVGVALKFVSAGVSQVVCVDKFRSIQDDTQQRKIYLALRATLSQQERRRFDQTIDLSRGIRVNPNRLRCIYGIGVEELAGIAKPESFDLILSRAVLQDVFEPNAAFDAMEDVLAPGGLMLHKIDLSDQGMFRDNGLHPLTFLTIPESVYRLMSADSGNSNRKRLSYYRDQMSRLGYDGEAFVTSTIGSRGGMSRLEEERGPILETDRMARSLVEEIRPRLAPAFASSSDEDLVVDGVFLVAKKPDLGNGFRVSRYPAGREVTSAALPFQSETHTLVN